MKKDVSLHTFPPKLIGLLTGLTLCWGLNWPMMKLAVTEIEPMHLGTVIMKRWPVGSFPPNICLTYPSVKCYTEIAPFEIVLDPR